MQDPFTFQDGKPVLNCSASNAATAQSWRELRSELDALGLYAYYDRTSGGLIAFDTNGKIAVHTPDGLVAVEPGKSIQQQSVSLRSLCCIRATTTLSNHGFLSDNQVVLR